MIGRRPDIDGLRAIAVLSVLLFHAGLSTFSGGFVGVDVLFVISGYLITGIIVEDCRKSRFSFVTFYTKRIRRIFPECEAREEECWAGGRCEVKRRISHNDTATHTHTTTFLID